MALLEHRHCPHCGKAAWQEFVPQADPAGSHWRCRDCGERRTATRVSLGRTALLHRGRVQTNRICAPVRIIDISREGARLCQDEDMPFTVAVEQRLLFNPLLHPTGELAQYLSAVVRWIEGIEFGLEFDRPLALPPGEIRHIVKN